MSETRTIVRNRNGSEPHSERNKRNVVLPRFREMDRSIRKGETLSVFSSSRK